MFQVAIRTPSTVVVATHAGHPNGDLPPGVRAA